MRDVNKVMLLGRLGADPVIRETKNGIPVATFPVATSSYYENKTEGEEKGTTHQKTEWHRVVSWGKQGESCANFLRKGHSVFVEGSIRSSQYSDKEGISRKGIEVHADKISFLKGSAQQKERIEAHPELEATG